MPDSLPQSPSQELHEDFFGPRGAFVRGLDPRARLIAAALTAVCVSCLQTLAASWAAFGLSLTLLAAANPPLRPLCKRLGLVNLFILFIWLTVPPSMSGESAFAFGPVHFSKPGLRLALLVTVKANALLLVFIALVAGLSVPRIGTALERLRVPGNLVFLLLFTYRYVHAISEEWQRLQVSAKLRGFVARNSGHTYATIGTMLGLVFVNSFDRAQRVYEAMLLRGFNGSFHTVGALEASRRDALFTALAFLALLAILSLDTHPELLPA